MDISVILPTHNEKENVSVLLWALDKVLKGKSAEVIVVDDGSTDGTEKICKQIAPHLKIPIGVFARKEKHGLGNAYKKGVSHATGKYILIMDADLSHDPREIPSMVEKMQETDAGVVVGSRYIKDGGVCNWPLFRRLTSRGANILAQAFTGKTVSDMTNSYRLYKSNVLRSALNDVESEGFSFQMEVLFRCQSPVSEVPAKFYERNYGTSKLSPKEYLNFLETGARILLTRAARAARSAIYAEDEIF